MGYINLNNLPPDSIIIPFQINIYSHNHHFWTDTATLRIEVITEVEESFMDSPVIYLLYQIVQTKLYRLMLIYRIEIKHLTWHLF